MGMYYAKKKVEEINIQGTCQAKQEEKGESHSVTLTPQSELSCLMIAGCDQLRTEGRGSYI